MARARFSTLAILAGALLVPGLVWGQAAPVSKQLEIASPRPSPWPSLHYHYMTPAAVELGPAGFAATWMTYYTTTDPHDYDRVSAAIDGMLVSRGGRPVSELFVSTDVSLPDGVEPPVMARTWWQDFVAVWSQPRDLGSDVWFRRFGPGGVPLEENARVLGDRPDDRIDASPAVAAGGGGRFAIAWMRNVVDPGDHSSRWTPMLQIFDHRGEPLTPEIEVSLALAGENLARPAVAVDAAETIMVLWPAPGARRLLLGQRFDSSGLPLGERFSLGEMGNGGVAAAAGTTRGFVAAWAGRGYSGETLTVVQKLFPTEGPVRFGVAGAGGFEPSLARDRHGNIALFWLDGKRPALGLFNQDLVRQGPTVHDPPAARRPGVQNTGGVTLADGGRIYTVWLGPWAGRSEPSILGRVWRARKDADLCVFRNGLYLCDTANDGGAADAKLRFGEAGETPFLADADGDGRAEPCVFRDRRFLCDTAHDGGDAEWETEMSEHMPAGAQPLLADISWDEDPYGDPCYRNGSRWVCLIWTQMHGTHEISWDFGRSTDVGLLGDVDGKLFVDLCVFRRGTFICQVWQGKGYVKIRFDLRPELNQLSGATPLLGDVDGDGRADPCLYGKGRLICGIFAPGRQRPGRTVELTYGLEGDVPVLGDVDAF